MTEWNLDWVSKVRKLAASLCNFYISQYYSSASLERGEHRWVARFYYAAHYVEVVHDTYDKMLIIRVHTLPDETQIEYKDCEVEGNLDIL